MSYAEFHKSFIFNLRQNRSREGTIVWLAFLMASTGTALSELKQTRVTPLSLATVSAPVLSQRCLAGNDRPLLTKMNYKA